MKKASKKQYFSNQDFGKVITSLGLISIAVRVVDHLNGPGIIPATAIPIGVILLFIGLILLLSDSKK